MLCKFNVSRGKKENKDIGFCSLCVHHTEQSRCSLTTNNISLVLLCTEKASEMPHFSFHPFLQHNWSIPPAEVFFCLPQDLHLLLSCQVLIWVLRIGISVFENLGCVLASSSMFAETRSKVTFAKGCKPDISVQL